MHGSQKYAVRVQLNPLAHGMKIADITRKDPNVDRILLRINTSGFLVVLKLRSERDFDVEQVIQELRPKLNTVPGIRAMPINRPPRAQQFQASTASMGMLLGVWR